MHEPLVIAGGGPAGAAAAISLARAGRTPLVIEKEREPGEKLCGCFLSKETVTMLARLGVDTEGLGASVIERVRLIRKGRIAEARLPFQARGLSRHILDAALIDTAEKAGAHVLRGQGIGAVTRSRMGSVLAMRGGGELTAAQLFLATGKHDVRGVGRPVAKPPSNIGLKQMFRLSPMQRERLAGAVELYLFDGGYAGLQFVEQRTANFCLVISDSSYQRRGGGWDALLGSLMQEMPLLADRLQSARPVLSRPLAVARIPYGFVHAPDAEERNLYRLGDQAAVIPSFSGDGMAIALYSGMLAADAMLRGRTAPEYQLELGSRLGRQFRVAGGLNSMARADLGRRAIMTVARLSPLTMRWAINATRLAAPGR